MLSEVCQNIDWANILQSSPNERHNHHMTLRNMVNAARQGCVLCSRLVFVLVGLQKDEHSKVMDVTEDETISSDDMKHLLGVPDGGAGDELLGSSIGMVKVNVPIGQSELSMLLVGNLNPWKKVRMIDVLELCPSFLDAFLVAHKLLISHVWSDSLCICQDDKEGWNREAPRTGNYYKRLFLTIAADSSSGDDVDFCEQPRTHVDRAPAPIPINVHIGQEQETMLLDVHEPSYDLEDGSTPLSRRACTLQ